MLNVEWNITMQVNNVMKLRPPSSIIKSVINQATTPLIFVGEVGKLRGGKLGKVRGNMGLWDANQLVSSTWFYNEKLVQQHFILHVTSLETRHNQYRHKTWFSLTNDPCRTISIANNVVRLQNIERWKSPPPYNTKLGSRESLITRSTPPSSSHFNDLEFYGSDSQLVTCSSFSCSNPSDG